MMEQSLAAQASLGRTRKQQGKRTLATVLGERGVLSTAHAVEVVLAICEALSSAHANGVVHGQLGLGCVRLLFTPEGGPRHIEIFTLEPSAPDGAPESGEAVVSAALFPELQSHPRWPVDARADIWALGGVLYTSLVGLAPSNLGVVPESVPRGLAAVIDACLAVDPASRPQTVDDLAERIASFATWPPDHFARLAERRERRESAERSRQDLERRGLGDMPNVLDKLDEAAIARARAQRTTTTPIPSVIHPIGPTTAAALERLMTAVHRASPRTALPALVDFDDVDEEVLPTLVQEETVRMEPIASPLVDPVGPAGPAGPVAPVTSPNEPRRRSPAFVFTTFALGAFALCLSAGYVGYVISRKRPRTPVAAAEVAIQAAPPASVSASEPEPVIPVFAPSALPEAPPVTPDSLPDAKP